MKTLRLLGVLVVSASTVALLTATPAMAAAGDTTTTFALAGGGLSVAVQPNAALTNGSTGATSISGQLGNVTVTDVRGTTAAWNVSATSTTFTTGSGPTSSAVSYSTGVVTTTGVSAVVAKTTALSTTPAVVATPTAIVGNNTASWNPTLTVTMPSNALTGDYTGTINTSVI